jgi:hypothetical protein
MGKVKYLLIIASFIICFVMVSLIFKGVHLKPKLMVKWSQIDSLEIAGQEMAQFLYPIFKENSDVVVISQEKLSHYFFKGLYEETLINLKTVSIQMGESKVSEKSFVIQVIELKEEDLNLKCDDLETIDCLKFKSFKLFRKKERDMSRVLDFYVPNFKEKSSLVFCSQPNLKINFLWFKFHTKLLSNDLQSSKTMPFHERGVFCKSESRFWVKFLEDQQV